MSRETTTLAQRFLVEFPEADRLVAAFEEEWADDDVPGLLAEQVIAPLFALVLQESKGDRHDELLARVASVLNVLADDHTTWNFAECIIEWLSSSSQLVDAIRPRLGKEGVEAADHALKYIVPSERTLTVPDLFDVRGVAAEMISKS